MPTVLSELKVSEISLVDVPACQTRDPKTGKKTPHATVALFKRDSDCTQQPRKDRKMTFSEVMKSAKTRDEIVAAVERRAGKIAKRDGISQPAALVKAWTPEAMDAYERAPLPVMKQERNAFNATNAEAILDNRARHRMKRTGCSFAKAYSAELDSDPTLYAQYEKELAAGQTFVVPEPALHQDGGNSRTLGKGDDGDDEEDDDLQVSMCADCKSGIRKQDRFCSKCGANLAKSRQPKARV